MAKGKESVRKRQEALKAAGFDPGPIDGIMGPRTRAAIRASERAPRVPRSRPTDAAARPAGPASGLPRGKGEPFKKAAREVASKEPIQEGHMDDALRRTYGAETPKVAPKQNALGRAIEGAWNRLSISPSELRRRRHH